MLEPPQVQSILSSRSISDKEANQIVSKFLVEQKKYFEDVETDVVPTNNTSEEDYFDMDDDDNLGTFEEVESRLGGIVRSLSGIKKPIAPTATPEKSIPATNAEDNEAEDNESDGKQSPEAEKAESTPTPIKNEEIILALSTPSEITKADKKSVKKAEKEAKKSVKKEAKKAEKEAKKSAKKEKKRKAHDTSSSTSKRVKKEE